MLITNVCTRTAAKAHVLQLLLFKGCFAKAYLRRDNDFGVTFFRSSRKRINREGFALQNVLRLLRNSKACKKKNENLVQDIGLSQSAPHCSFESIMVDFFDFFRNYLVETHRNPKTSHSQCNSAAFRAKELESGVSIAFQRVFRHALTKMDIEGHRSTVAPCPDIASLQTGKSDLRSP